MKLKRDLTQFVRLSVGGGNGQNKAAGVSHPKRSKQSLVGVLGAISEPPCTSPFLLQAQTKDALVLAATTETAPGSETPGSPLPAPRSLGGHPEAWWSLPARWTVTEASTFAVTAVDAA